MISGRQPLEVREEIAGRVARRRLAPGAVLLRDDLAPAVLVRRGAVVRVEADSSAAHVELDAVADMDGGSGDRVALRNPLSGKRFFARVQAPGRLRVELDNLPRTSPVERKPSNANLPDPRIARP